MVLRVCGLCGAGGVSVCGCVVLSGCVPRSPSRSLVKNKVKNKFLEGSCYFLSVKRQRKLS